MTRDDVIAKLRAHEIDLKRRGVTHAALFGSLARGDAGADSDIDVMVEIDPEAHIGLWGYSAVVLFIQSLFDRQVDVADREGLRAYVRPSAERDAIYAF